MRTLLLMWVINAFNAQAMVADFEMYCAPSEIGPIGFATGGSLMCQEVARCTPVDAKEMNRLRETFVRSNDGNPSDQGFDRFVASALKQKDADWQQTTVVCQGQNGKCPSSDACRQDQSFEEQPVSSTERAVSKIHYETAKNAPAELQIGEPGSDSPSPRRSSGSAAY